MLALRLALVAAAFLTPAMAAAPDPQATVADTVAMSIDASKPGAKIDRNIFGQFAEHLGTGIYEGVWVGPDSPIPNTRGIRNDVVAALKALKVPNVRWPGGASPTTKLARGIGKTGPRPSIPTGGASSNRTLGTHESGLHRTRRERGLPRSNRSGTRRKAAEYGVLTQTSQRLARAGRDRHPAP